MTTPSQHLEAIRARVEAATPGPWEYGTGFDGSRHIAEIHNHKTRRTVTAGHYGDGRPHVDHTEEQCLADAAFIAAAPEDIRFLLGEVERHAELLDLTRRAAEMGWKRARTSCMCGGEWAWLKPRSSGAFEMVGCECHRLRAALEPRP